MKLIKKYKIPLIFLTLLFLGILIGSLQQINQNPTIANNTNLKTFTTEQLSKFNGDDENSPIYLALNGYVYDVSTGREFYKPGASYHDLAGKDSSKLLNLVGGDIIKRKYPIVGKLIN